MSRPDPRRGPACRVRGGMFYPLTPTPDVIFVRDMAHALSNLSRWGGHCGPYTVAQHAVAVSLLAERLVYERGGSLAEVLAAGRAGLHHEAAEAFGLGDVTRPYYAAVPALRDIHDRILEVALESIGLSPILPPVVRQADDDLCMTEAVQFFGIVEVAGWGMRGTIRPECFGGGIWTHAHAEKAFLERHEELGLPLPR